MSTRIELIDTPSAPEGALRALHELYLKREEELEPAGDPPLPWAQRLVEWRNLLASEAVPRWVLWEGERVVATSGASMDLEQNLDNAFGWVYVHPDHRGRGYGKAIATAMLDAVQAAGRVRLALEINAGRPEEEVARIAGMKPAYTEKRSRLVLADLDWGLMALWVKRAEERAFDYELLFLTSPMPDEHVEAFCRLWQIMNTAPREDYVEEDQVLTPERLRDIERQDEARAKVILSYLARHKPTGDLAGFTGVTCHHLQPDLIWQGDTGVDPAHRNKGIGRWLKATMAMRLREDCPEARRIDTYNAGSNAPMLSINVEMGFKPIMTETVWQGDLATIRERLSI